MHETAVLDQIISPGSSQGDNPTQLSNASSEYHLTGRDYVKQGLRGTVNVMTETLVSVLDYARVTYRNTVRIFAAVADSLHVDMEDLILNRNSFCAMRKKIREEKAGTIKRIFGELELDAAVLHVEGKRMLDKTTRKFVERLPIVLSNRDITKILDIPKLGDARGKTQAQAVYNVLYFWGLVTVIKAICLDTTPSNLGRKSGIAVILEHMMETDLLWLPCRHHIYEIILGEAFKLMMPKTSGPEVQLFKDFQSSWDDVDKTCVRIPEDDEIHPLLLNQKEELLNFYRNFDEKCLPRDDYKELLYLIRVFLGDIPRDGVRFETPGAMHHARWMAKPIYSFKMYLLRDSLNLSEEQEEALRAICFFVAFVYGEAWFRTPLAASAPNNDLNFMKNLKSYRAVDERLANACLKKMSHHLWYLGPETVALAFFDPNLSRDVKNKMAEAVSFDPGDTVIPKRLFLRNESELEEIIDQDLSSFVNAQSLRFFERFSIGIEFLSQDSNSWANSEGFLKGQSIAQGLQVVNDIAERAVKLAEEYMTDLTVDEEQKQFIVQIVEDFRKQYPNANKSTFVNNLQNQSRSDCD